MSTLAVMHILALGFWGGVVGVEVLFELRGLQGGLPSDVVARMHSETDRFLEIPLLILVVASGALLWQQRGWSPELLPKVLLGLGAVAANLGNVVFVHQRAKGRVAAASVPRYLAATVLPGLVFAGGALYVGGHRAGWW